MSKISKDVVPAGGSAPVISKTVNLSFNQNDIIGILSDEVESELASNVNVYGKMLIEMKDKIWVKDIYPEIVKNYFKDNYPDIVKIAESIAALVDGEVVYNSHTIHTSHTTGYSTYIYPDIYPGKIIESQAISKDIVADYNKVKKLLDNNFNIEHAERILSDIPGFIQGSRKSYGLVGIILVDTAFENSTHKGFTDKSNFREETNFYFAVSCIKLSKESQEEILKLEECWKNYLEILKEYVIALKKYTHFKKNEKVMKSSLIKSLLKGNAEGEAMLKNIDTLRDKVINDLENVG